MSLLLAVAWLRACRSLLLVASCCCCRWCPSPKTACTIPATVARQQDHEYHYSHDVLDDPEPSTEPCSTTVAEDPSTDAKCMTTVDETRVPRRPRRPHRPMFSFAATNRSARTHASKVYVGTCRVPNAYDVRDVCMLHRMLPVARCLTFVVPRHMGTRYTGSPHSYLAFPHTLPDRGTDISLSIGIGTLQWHRIRPAAMVPSHSPWRHMFPSLLVVML